jgi:transposase-like protein
MANSIVPIYERFDRDGLELIIDTATGLAYATVSAIARMLGVNKGTISKGVANYNEIPADIETAGGLQAVSLYPADVVLKLAIKHNPELAERMGTTGANLYMLGLAGYQVKIEPVKPKTALELAKEQVKLLEQLELQAAQIEALEQETERQAEIIDELFDYSSIVRIAKFNQCDEKAFSWRTLKAASKVLGLEIKQAPCPRFETKNLYSHDAWRFAYPGYRLPETLTLTINQQASSKKQ